MKTHLSREQIHTYRERGFLIIEDFLNSKELQLWQKYVKEAVANRDGFKLPKRKWKSGDSHYDHVFVQCFNLWQDHEGVRTLMFDTRLGKLATELAGVDGVRIWHDQALIKEPWANPTAWHTDSPYWSFSSPEAISIWVALDDMTPENGCLYFIPGTHKTRGEKSIGTEANMGDLFTLYPDWGSQDAEPAIMKAGSCCFHNAHVAHAAGPNMTPKRRRAMTCNYMPVGSTFNGNPGILSEEELAKREVGEVFDDNDLHPLVYQKTHERYSESNVSL